MTIRRLTLTAMTLGVGMVIGSMVPGHILAQGGSYTFQLRQNGTPLATVQIPGDKILSFHSPTPEAEAQRKASATADSANLAVNTEVVVGAPSGMASKAPITIRIQGPAITFHRMPN